MYIVGSLKTELRILYLSHIVILVELIKELKVTIHTIIMYLLVTITFNVLYWIRTCCRIGETSLVN